MTYVFFCVKSKVWSYHLKGKTLLTCTTLVTHLLAASITSKSALKVTSKKLRWGAKVPPYLPFLPSRLFLRLNLLKENKRFWNINWHRWNWLCKINTEISGRIGGNLHLKERKQYKQHWWSECFKRKNGLSNNFAKITFHFHTQATIPKGTSDLLHFKYIRSFLLFQSTTPLKKQPVFDCCFASYLIFSLAFKLPTSHHKILLYFSFSMQSIFLSRQLVKFVQELELKGKK